MMFNENQVFVQISEQAYDYALCTRMFYNNVRYISRFILVENVNNNKKNIH